MARHSKKLLSLRLAAAAIAADIGDLPRQYPSPRNTKIQTRNLTPEELAERDRPVSRQERRQMERLAKKSRTLPGRDE